MSQEIKRVDTGAYQNMNRTELANLLRTRTGMVIKRSVEVERLIHLLETGEQPSAEEVSPTTDSRKRLQLFLEKNWSTLNSQLPCKGDNRGKCTIYPCPEGRHVDCYLSAEPHMRVHAII